MSTEHNKAAAKRLFELFTASDIPGVMALMTDDATWRIPGKKELTPTAGVYSRKNIEKLFYRMLEGLAGGLRMSATSIIAEGDKVAVEAVSEGDLKNGRRYRQEYHFLFEFRDGKISAVREYLDTQHAHDVWIRAG